MRARESRNARGRFEYFNTSAAMQNGSKLSEGGRRNNVSPAPWATPADNVGKNLDSESRRAVTSTEKESAYLQGSFEEEEEEEDMGIR